MKFISYLLIFSLITETVKCQMSNNKFEILSNKFYFNVLQRHPDSIIAKFIDQNIPIYSEKTLKNSWLAKPSNINLDKIEKSIKIFKFFDYSFIDQTLVDGQVEFLIKEYQGKFIGLSDMRLIMTFQNDIRAKNFFEMLVKEFSSLSTEIKNDKTSVTFYNSDSNTMAGIVTIMFEPHINNQHKIIYKLGNRNSFLK